MRIANRGYRRREGRAGVVGRAVSLVQKLWTTVRRQVRSVGRWSRRSRVLDTASFAIGCITLVISMVP